MIASPDLSSSLQLIYTDSFWHLSDCASELFSTLLRTLKEQSSLNLTQVFIEKRFLKNACSFWGFHHKRLISHTKERKRCRFVNKKTKNTCGRREKKKGEVLIFEKRYWKEGLFMLSQQHFLLHAEPSRNRAWRNVGYGWTLDQPEEEGEGGSREEERREDRSLLIWCRSGGWFWVAKRVLSGSESYSGSSLKPVKTGCQRMELGNLESEPRPRENGDRLEIRSWLAISKAKAEDDACFPKQSTEALEHFSSLNRERGRELSLSPSA